MGIPQLQVTSEFSWDRDIYVEPWCFLCCKTRTRCWTNSCVVSEMRLLSVVMIYCNNIQQHWSMQWLDTEQNQINCLNQWPLSSLMLVCHWTVISETIKRVAITHEYEMAWKRVLHYFDLHLNRRLNKQPICLLLNALRRRQVTVMASQLPANRMFAQ